MLQPRIAVFLFFAASGLSAQIVNPPTSLPPIAGQIISTTVGPANDATDGTKILYNNPTGWLAVGASDALHFGSGNLTAGGIPSVDWGGFTTGGVFSPTNIPIFPVTGLMYGNNTTAVTAASAAQVVGVIGATAVANATSATQVNTNTFPAAAGFTSGGVPYYSTTSAEASSALLTNHAVVIGGGAAAAPRTIAACGANFPIIGAAGADPTCSTIGWLTSATQWGIPYMSTATQMSTTAALTANALIKAGSGAAPAASSVVDDGKNITSTEIAVLGNKVFVTGDFTDSTSGTLTAITGLTFTLPTSKAVNVSFHCSLIFNQGTAAVVDSFGIGVTGTAPTSANAMGVVYPSASTLTSGNLLLLASTTPTAVVTFTPSAITTNWNATLDGTIEQPSNATPGVFNVYVSTTTGTDNLIVKRGSYCTLF